MIVHSFRALSHFENYATENDAYALDPLELAQFDSYCVAYEFDHISVNSESGDAYARCHVTGVYGETYRYDLVKAGHAE